MKPLIGVVCVAFLVFVSAGASVAQVDTVGGPYVVDTNTVVLLHFDGNMRNAAAAVGKTADSLERHTTGGAGKIYFINSSLPGMGQCVRLDNGAITDSTYLTLADTAALDLTGDWTIEAWANIFSFGSGASDWRWVPRVVMKPGVDVFWHPNYWLEMWGDNRLFHAGYYTPGDKFVSVTSENNMFTPGAWVHLTFIRDTKRGIIAQMVHDVNKKLLSFTAAGFDPAVDVPRPNINPLHIGWAGSKLNATPSNDSWLDGFVDEIRISKVVRNFAGPPLVTNVTVLGNQPSSAATFPISAKVQPFTTGATITNVMLHYRFGSGSWDSVAMSGTAPNFTGSIPGNKPVGTKVRYFVSAKDNQLLYSMTPLRSDVDTAAAYSFYIFEPNAHLLWLTFEEGPSGRPVDHSPSPKTIKSFKTYKYSTNAKQGTYSFQLDTNFVRGDSNWVEADFPSYLNSQEFCLDFWMRADTSVHATRVINYPYKPDDWNNNMFEIGLRNNGTTGIAITARYWVNDLTASVLLQDPSAVQHRKWYHVIFERNATNNVAGLVIRDENDVQLYKQTKVEPKPPIVGGSNAPATVRIGRAYTLGGPGTADWGFIPPFAGLLDNIKLYNYAQSGITGVGGSDGQQPWKFDLAQNYPNPFNPSTRIQFSVPKFMAVELVVFDMLGRRVKTLVNEERHAGEHWVMWDGKNDIGRQVASGVYFYRLKAGDNVKTQKMMLMK